MQVFFVGSPSGAQLAPWFASQIFSWRWLLAKWRLLSAFVWTRARKVCREWAGELHKIEELFTVYSQFFAQRGMVSAGLGGFWPIWAANEKSLQLGDTGAWELGIYLTIRATLKQEKLNEVLTKASNLGILEVSMNTSGLKQNTETYWNIIWNFWTKIQFIPWIFHGCSYHGCCFPWFRPQETAVSSTAWASLCAKLAGLAGLEAPQLVVPKHRRGAPSRVKRWNPQSWWMLMLMASMMASMMDVDVVVHPIYLLFFKSIVARWDVDSRTGYLCSLWLEKTTSTGMEWYQDDFHIHTWLVVWKMFYFP